MKKVYEVSFTVKNGEGNTVGTYTDKVFASSARAALDKFLLELLLCRDRGDELAVFAEGGVTFKKDGKPSEFLCDGVAVSADTDDKEKEIALF